jgi:hypothetical protein
MLQKLLTVWRPAVAQGDGIEAWGQDAARATAILSAAADVGDADAMFRRDPCPANFRALARTQQRLITAIRTARKD